ncbi:MAG: DUF2203 domain-containing protein [Armatimonadetes bacterium]|nr:DUF2203 domain-containing protein [Armatimonadota bacterium]
MIPSLEPLVRDMVQKKRQADFCFWQLGILRERAAQGERFDQDEFSKKTRELSGLEQEILEIVGKVQSHGCTVKDLGVGLLDFPAVIEQKPAYLCWRLGETEVRFWHTVDDGFAGRRRLE